MSSAPKAYEVWLKRNGKPWTLIVNKETTNGNWETFKKAEKVARDSSREEDAVEVTVIERIPVLRLNGPIHAEASIRGSNPESGDPKKTHAGE